MEIDVVEASPAEVAADVLAFAVPEPIELQSAGQELDRLVDGGIQHLIEDGELKGERGRVTLLHTRNELKAHRVAVGGMGADGDSDSLRTAAAAVARRAGEIGGKTVAWILSENGLPPAEQARAVVDGMALGPYDAGIWKTKDEHVAVERLVLCGSGATEVVEEAQRANVVAAWTNRCRDLVNAPPNVCTPTTLAEFAEDTASRFEHMSFSALGPDEIREAGMGALTAVSQGSENPPRLITLSYEPPSATRGEVVLGLVGKAITFDSGGLSLKPASRMEEMKTDMGGGGAVLAAMGAIAELGLPVKVLAVVPSCENMPGGRSYRPGDIITALNGKTIEVTNTDAEGRLILADALTHARRSGATHILDLATLTGAIVIAMGDYYAGLFANDDAWAQEIRAAAEESGDHAWIMPLHETYRRYIESPYADMKNSSEYRQGSPILAARFLQEFVGEGPWAHLDIAGTAYLERTREDYYGAPGATGYGVRLLAELAQPVFLVNFELSDDHQLLRQTVRDFAEERIAPVAEELDREHRFPYDIVEALAELGLMGIPIPEEHGGGGGDTLAYAIAVEELTRIDSSVAITVAAHTSLGTMPILLFGSDEQKERWLPELASGQRLAAFGLTEPEAGSDAGATRTTAELRDGSWVVNGSKIFITNAGTDISAFVTITARTGDDEISNIVVPNGTEGYELSAPMRKMGWRASDTRELSFHDCAVPEDHLLGERGAGLKQFLEILDGGRISVAAMGLGLAQGAFDLASSYARERKQFGQPIGKFQAIQFQLADMATEIEAGRNLVYKAAWLKDDGRPFAQAAAIAKLYTGELANRAVNAALQIHGGYGFMDEYAISRLYRDQKVLEIGEGTNEIQRLVIARGLGF